MYRYEDIRLVHLEITTRCNARCPQCPRNLWGGVANPGLPQVELDLGACKKLFPPPFVAQLRQLYMCGDYGDPIVARDTLNVYRYLRECSDTINLKMHTNGSGRKPEWWAHLAETGCTVRFAIDGLEDTNHLYRRGTQWRTIMAGAEAFVGAGGNAEWAFIAFRHNEHQVDEAREVARQLGFHRFILKRTKRFFDSAAGSLIDRTPVHSLTGELEYYLEPPENPSYQIPVNGPWNEHTSKGAYSTHLLSTPIDCRAVHEGMVYVSAEGMVLPCCWLGNLYPREFPKKRPEVWSLIERLPEKKDSLDGVRHGLRSVVEGPFFQQLIPERWAPADQMADRLLVCARICGKCNILERQNESVTL